MTQSALLQGFDGRKKRSHGVIVSRFKNRDGDPIVVVIRDGFKTKEYYAACHWEPELSQSDIVDATLAAFAASFLEQSTGDSHPSLSRRNPTDNHGQTGTVVPLTPDAPVMLSASQSRSPCAEQRPLPREYPGGSTANPTYPDESSSCRALGVTLPGSLAVP